MLRSRPLNKLSKPRGGQVGISKPGPSFAEKKTLGLGRVEVVEENEDDEYEDVIESGSEDAEDDEAEEDGVGSESGLEDDDEEEE